MILFFDTETSGLPNAQLPLDHAAQPHIVQIAAIITDHTGRELGIINSLIRPDGYTIPPIATRIHGISTELALQGGIDVRVAIAHFNQLAMRSDEIVAHNISFDLQLYQIELSRLKAPSRVDSLKRCCTMELTRDIVKLPPTPKMIAANFLQHKSPKLEEAYKFLFGKELVGAHDALVDVRACKEIYFFLRGMTPPVQGKP